MNSSIERAGWYGAAVGGGLGAIAAVVMLGGPAMDSPKAPVVLPLAVIGLGCICGFFASVASIVVACIVQLFRRHKTELANTGQPQSPPRAYQPPADGPA